MIQLELQPEIEAQLLAQAAAQGVEPEMYVAMLVSSDADDSSSAEELRLQAELREGLKDIAEGRTRPAREVFAELCKGYGIRG